VTLEPEDAQELESLVKCEPPPRVTLLHQSTSAYSFSAAPVNKILLAHYSNGGARCVEHVKGKLSNVSGRNEMVPEVGAPETIDPPSRFSHIRIRHGAVPAAATLLSAPEMAMLRELANSHPEAAELSGYDEKKYAWTRKGIGSAEVGLEALRNSVKRALKAVARAYNLELSDIRIAPECFTRSEPITVTLPSSDREISEKLRLFPMKVGPAIVILADPGTSREIDYGKA
jgi:hypothetical protein